MEVGWDEEVDSAVHADLEEKERVVWTPVAIFWSSIGQIGSQSSSYC